MLDARLNPNGWHLKPVKIKLSSVVTCRSITDSCALGKHEIATVLVKNKKQNSAESSADVMDEFKKHPWRPWRLELLKWFHRAMISLSAVDNSVNSCLLRSPHNYFVMRHIAAALPLHTHFNTASAIVTVNEFSLNFKIFFLFQLWWLKEPYRCWLPVTGAQWFMKTIV